MFRTWVVIGLAGGILTCASSDAALAQQGPTAAPADQAVTTTNGIETRHSGENIIQTDRTGKGAVLCMWGILEAVRATGRECFEGQDQEFQAELDSSLARIDQFIIRNSSRPVTQAGLELRRSQAVQQLRSSGNVCAGDTAKMYQALRTGGADRLRGYVTDMLSIPREPVINPCL